MTINAEQQKAIAEICRAFSRKIEKGARPGPFVIELTRLFPSPSPLQKKILRETRRACDKVKQAERCGPMLEEILMVLCSWGDTLEETQVLAYMEAITEHGTYRLGDKTGDEKE